MKNATVPATFVTFTFSDDWLKKIGEKLAIKKKSKLRRIKSNMLLCITALYGTIQEIQQ